jgi:hypothetical protein
MDDRIPALVFGVCLALGGIAALIWHVRTWRARRGDETLSSEESRYYRRQFLRRMQTSGLIVVIGVLFPVGDGLIPKETWKENPGWFAAYWMMVLGLALWVMALGLSDLLSTRIHSRDALGKLRKLREQQRELEREIAQIKAGGRNPPPQL